MNITAQNNNTDLIKSTIAVTATEIYCTRTILRLFSLPKYISSLLKELSHHLIRYTNFILTKQYCGEKMLYCNLRVFVATL